MTPSRMANSSGASHWIASRSAGMLARTPPAPAAWRACTQLRSAPAPLASTYSLPVPVDSAGSPGSHILPAGLRALEPFEHRVRTKSILGAPESAVPHSHRRRTGSQANAGTLHVVAGRGRTDLERRVLSEVS